MEQLCRGCLMKYDEPQNLLQYTEKNRRLFVYLTGIQVKRNDVFTFQLCKNCYLNMKLACKFKKLCRTSDKKLKDYLSLKELDQTLDLSNYLKQNNDDLNIRFPFFEGSRTPGDRKLKDDDNESTCTSIRNFMTDLLRGQEMPDTEARIIKEVIEEEADVLEDSLDSHWLQDDASIDTDFRLDFSFSPFSTPRQEKHDNCYTPTKLSKQKEQEQLNYYTSKAIIEEPDRIDELDTINKAIDNIPNTENIFDNIVISPKNDLTIEKQEYVTLEIEPSGTNAQNYYVQRDIFDDSLVTKDDIILKNSVTGSFVEPISLSSNTETKVDENNERLATITQNNNYVQIDILGDNSDTKIVDKTVECTIDRNLETALRNEMVDEISLENLLVSPPAYANAGQWTPTITRILFSDKLDPTSPINQNTGQCIQNFQNIEGCDTLDGFFNDSKDYDPDSMIKDVLNEVDKEEINQKEPVVKIYFQKLVENDERDITTLVDSFDFENTYCKLCDKNFDTSKSFRLHVVKRHKIKIINKERKVYKFKDHTCEICGKSFRQNNLARHRLTHINTDPNKVYRCNICSLTFTSKVKVGQHMIVHKKPTDIKSGHVTDESVGPKKKFVCTICGKSCSNKTNFTTHQWRHTKSYQFHCTECGKGFYRTTDLTIHMRYHTSEKPLNCPHCSRRFAYSTSLLQHVKRFHLGTKYYECDCCNIRYTKKTELKKHLRKEEGKRRKKLQKKNITEAIVTIKSMENET